MIKLLLTIFLFILSSQAWASTYYVRDGGGSVYGTSAGTNVCNGTVNVVYSLGVSPNCAVNHPALILGGGVSGSATTNLMVGGDTIYIDGDSDTSPGNQAQYLIGYGMPNTGGTCNLTPYSCTLNSLPAGTGTGSARTQMIGTGTHKPQLYSNPGTWQVIGSTVDHVNYQWLELTDHVACAYNDPTGGCVSSVPYPDGMYLGDTGNDLTLTDIYIHGFGRYGINGQAFGSATFTRVWAIGNGYGGIIIGNAGNQSVTGTLTFNQPIVEWNGCVESYPMTNTGIDNPLNYSNCFGQSSGGYGDGLAFGATGGQPAGNWIITGPGSISFNTQDGWDILHGISGTGTDSADKMRFEGNAGQQIKLTGFNDNITNNVIIGDCGWWQGSARSLSGGMQYGDSCRAEGDVILIAVTLNSVDNFYNNTIIANGIGIDYKDTGSTGCNSNTKLNIYNNIALGGPWWLDDSTINPGNNGGNSLATWTYSAGNDGNGSGTCGSLVPTEDYNVVYDFKNSNFYCSGTHDKCGTLPGFINQIPNGVLNGNQSTFYNGWTGVSYMPINVSGASAGAGLNGLTYWNTENDYYNVARVNPPSIGALEVNSCTVNSSFCFYNSDCCSGNCSFNACVGVTQMSLDQWSGKFSGNFN